MPDVIIYSEINNDDERISWLLFQGWYIVTYALGIYLLSLLLAFLTPKVDPAMATADADDGRLSYKHNCQPVGKLWVSHIALPLFENCHFFGLALFSLPATLATDGIFVTAQ